MMLGCIFLFSEGKFNSRRCRPPSKMFLFLFPRCRKGPVHRTEWSNVEITLNINGPCVQGGEGAVATATHHVMCRSARLLLHPHYVSLVSALTSDTVSTKSAHCLHSSAAVLLFFSVAGKKIKVGCYWFFFKFQHISRWRTHLILDFFSSAGNMPPKERKKKGHQPDQEVARRNLLGDFNQSEPTKGNQPVQGAQNKQPRLKKKFSANTALQKVLSSPAEKGSPEKEENPPQGMFTSQPGQFYFWTVLTLSISHAR